MAKKINPDDYKNIRDMTAELQKNLALSDEYTEQIAANFSKIKSKTTDVSKIQEEIVKNLQKELNVDDALVQVKAEINKLLVNEDNLSYSIRNKLLKQLDSATEYLKIRKLAVEQDEKLQRILDKMNDKASGIINSLKSNIESIPVVGKTLSKVFNFKKINKNFNKHITTNFSAGFKKLKADGKSYNKAVAGGMKSAIGGLGSFAAASGPVLIALAAIAAAAFLIKKAFDFDKEVTNLARGLGLAKDESYDLLHSVEMMSIKEPLTTSHELISATKELAAGLGGIAGINKQMITDQAKLVKFMQMSNDQALTFQIISGANGKTVREMQGDIAASVHQFNKATGAAVPLAAVMRDIADTSLVTQKNFKGNTDALVQATAHARLLGTTVDKLAQSTRGMLDIESSLSNQYSAQVLVKKELHLDAIRSAKLSGDEGEAQRLLLADIESMGDISKKNLIVQEELAKAYGMSADELLMINERSKLNKKLNIDISKATLKDLKTQLDLNHDLTKAQKEKLIREKESQSAGERIAKLWDAVGVAFNSAIAGPLSGVLDDLTKWLEDGEGLKDMFNGIAATFDRITTPIKLISLALETFTNNLDLSVNLVKKLGYTIADFLGGDHSKELAELDKSIKQNINKSVNLGFEKTATVNKSAITQSKVYGFDTSKMEKLGEIIAQKQQAYNKQNSEAVDDLIITPTGQTYKTHQDDFIIATKNPNNTSNTNTQNSSNVESLLEKLITAVAQPVYLKFDDGTVQLISNRSGFINKMGAGLGLG